VRGLVRVAAAAAALGAAATAAGDARVHVVRPGESLWTIAAELIGDASLWPALYRANRDQIVDPHLLHPGQRLAIPQVDAAARDEVRREARALLAK